MRFVLARAMTGKEGTGGRSRVLPWQIHPPRHLVVPDSGSCGRTGPPSHCAGELQSALPSRHEQLMAAAFHEGLCQHSIVSHHSCMIESAVSGGAITRWNSMVLNCRLHWTAVTR